MGKDKNKMINFLKEYFELCKKYDLYIGACGCCNSPWVTSSLSQMDLVDHIVHLCEEAKIDPKEILSEDLLKQYEEYSKISIRDVIKKGVQAVQQSFPELDKNVTDSIVKVLFGDLADK